MSEFTAVCAVSATLQKLLTQHITDDPDPQLKGVPIELISPKELRDATKPPTPPNGISLWLYRIARNAELLNQPPERVDDQVLRHPLPIDLYYLVAPITATPESEQTLLGRVLQVFNDHSRLLGADLQDDLADEDTELQLTLETLTLEELTRVWNALDEPYQLSVSYRVQVVNISSGHQPYLMAPVHTRQTRYDEILTVR
jgi:hypothetical protein